MKIAIFGLGYVGKRLLPVLSKNYEVTGYSANTQMGSSVLFDANNLSHIQNLKEHRYDATITTFPLHDVHEQFIPTLFSICSHNILFGSTGIYKRSSFGETIHEQTELVPQHKRESSEQIFVKNRGIVIRLAGIYGPQRVPINWLKSPRIGYNEKQLNLIHVDDIIRATVFVLQQKPQHNIYNLSDGITHTWKMIIDFARNHNMLSHEVPPKEMTENSFVSNDLFCDEYPNMTFCDLFEFLQSKGEI